MLSAQKWCLQQKNYISGFLFSFQKFLLEYESESQSLSHVQLFVTQWTVAHQAPLSMESLGKDTGVGCHFLLEGIFLTQGSNLHLLCLLYCRQIQNTTCFTCFLAFVYILLLEYKFIFGTFACFVHHHAGVLKYLLKGRIA